MVETKIDFSKYHNALSRRNQVIRMLWTIVWGVFARPLPRSVGSGWKRFLPRLLLNPLITAPIVIEDQAWVAAGTFIGMGVTIGQGAVVGARAAVFKSVEPWTVVGGNPAKFIKKWVIKG